jgi:hypothetical protein
LEQDSGISSLQDEFFRGYGAEIKLIFPDSRPNLTYKPTYMPRATATDNIDLTRAGSESRMDEPAVSFVRLPYDKSAWRVVIQASNGQFTGDQEFYVDTTELGEFARRLAAFPSGPDDEARLVQGSRDGNWAYYLIVRAFLIDRAEHAALEFAFDNRQPSPDHAQVSVFIRCEVAAISRLGQWLGAWLRGSDEPLTWTPTHG